MHHSNPLALVAAPVVLLVSPVAGQSICGMWDHFPSPNFGGDVEGPYVLRVVAWDDGSGPSLFIAGRFEGPIPAIRHIGRWDGETYRALGEGLGSLAIGVVRDLLVFDDGTGAALYAAGQFSNMLQSSPGFARWDGQQWSFPLAWPPYGGAGTALAKDGDGASASIYVATQSGLVRMQAGSAAAIPGAPGNIHSLAVYDDGNGAALYIGGYFQSAGGVTVSSLARYQSGAWSSVGGGVFHTAGSNTPGTINRLAVLDDGSGPALFVVGYFTRLGTPWGPFTPGVGRWNGTTWKAYPHNQGGFVSMAGDGPRVVAMLGTTTPPTLLIGAPLLRFMPSSGPIVEGGLLAWTEADGWRHAGPPHNAGVYELHMENPQRLIVAGILESSSLPTRTTMARWSPCPSCYANCDRSTVPPILNIEDFSCFINAFAAANALPPEQQLAHYANCDQSTTTPVLNVEDFTCFINQFAAGCP
jgi:hypothetical protein